TLVAPDTDNAQIGNQRGERIIGDFRLGRRHCTDKGALAGIRHAQQADISQYLQLQLEITRVTRLARRGLPRGTVGAGLEARIAQPMPTTLSDQQLLTRLGQITNYILGSSIDHRSAHRHRQEQIFPLGASTFGASALLTIGRIEATGVTVIDQGIEVFVGHQINGAAVAAVTTVGAAFIDEFFATKTHHAVTAVAGLYKNRYIIDEFHGIASRRRDGLKNWNKGLAKNPAKTE